VRYLLPLALPLSLLAWNETGHKAIALLAYENLNQAARDAADALLREHPHFATWKGHPFQEAAYWPDVIRRNPQYDHPTWHYINVPFSPDGTPFPAIDYDAPGVLSKIREFRRSVGDRSQPAAERAIQLAWILHLVGDVHNPLHTVARFTQTLPKGDRGGNDVHVRGARNLHAYWDALLGDTPTAAYITKVAQSLKTEAREKPVNLNERQWVDQGVEIAKASVYTFGNENGTKQDPLVLPDSYRAAARKVARARAALAGYRLAALLNEVLASKQ
jgi:hypothetical protein